ncbi:MAG: Maf-like protein [Alphaproteobacteria bacterium]|nr:MAG: Maf-like protein [Alphaproteobacteria bacterium]
MINKTKSILKSNFPIILASNSESRLKILQETGIDFIQLKSNIDESLVKEKYKKKNANFIATKLAEAKALFISRENRKSYVIGADQICISKGKIFSKPKNKKKAIEQLSELNGKTHKLISAFSICYDNQVVYSYVEEVKLKMRKLSKKSIKDYVEIDLPISSCGSYRFEANGKYLFSDVVGNTSTILGLPILPLIKILFKKKIITYV